jgi:hypothetical protein
MQLVTALPVSIFAPEFESEPAMPAWDAPVFTGPMLAPNGRPIQGRVGIFTGDGIFLGDYAKETTLLPNVDLVGMFESALADLGLAFSRHIMAGWGTLRVRYTLPGVTVATPDGKGVSLVVEIQNSYNGTLKVAGIIRALRLICANGMVGLADVFSLTKRHSAQLDVAGITQTIAPAIELEANKLGQSFRAMAELALPLAHQVNIIRNLAGRSSKFPRRVARAIERTLSVGMADTADTAGTLWNLYNAGTRVLSEREREGYAVSDAQNQYWGLVVTDLASGAPNARVKLSEYVLPRSREEAYGDEADLE